MEKQNKDKDKDIVKNEIIDNDKNEDINKGKDKDTEKITDKVINKKWRHINFLRYIFLWIIPHNYFYLNNNNEWLFNLLIDV